MGTEEQGGQKSSGAQDCARHGQTGSHGGRPGRRGHNDDRRRRGRPQGIGQADRLADADGDDSAGQAHRQYLAAIKDFVPLADLNDVVFTGWDIFEDNVYEAAAHAKVLDEKTLLQLKPYLETIKPLPAVFDQFYVKRLHGTHVKTGKNKRDLAEQVRADIQAFKKTVDRVVVIWAASTEIFLEPTAVHQID